MKYTILFIIILSLSFSLFGQSSYEIVMDNHSGGLIKNVVKKENDSFFFPITKITETDFIRPYDISYYELDEYGNLSEISVDLGIEPYHVFHMRSWKDGLLFDIENTWPNDGTNPDDESPYQRCILELDSDFQITDSLCFISRGHHFGKAVFDEDERYIFVCNESFALPNVLFGIYGEEEKRIDRYDWTRDVYYPTGLAKAPNESDFILLGYNGVRQVNENFRLVESLREKFKFTGFQGYLLNLNNDNIAVGGVNKLGYEADGFSYIHNLVTISVYDPGFELVWSDTLGIVPEDLRDDSGKNFPALDVAIDTFESNLFFAGINRIIGLPLSTNAENSFFIAKYDQETGAVIWKYDQLMPDYHTIIYGVKATTDGGCLLYGYRTIPSTFIRYPYLLKLDADGLLSTSTKPEEDATFRFTIYGNPSDQLRFHVNSTEGWQGRYQLLNTSGQVVMQDVVQNGFYTGNTSGLPGGVYIVVLMDQSGRMVTQQKWVKH